MDNPGIVHLRRLHSLRDNHPCEKVAAPSQWQQLLVSLLFRGQPPCGLDVQLSRRPVDHEVDFMELQFPLPLLVDGNDRNYADVDLTTAMDQFITRI